MIAVTPENSEWYTPGLILDRVYATLGTISLDPCSNQHGKHVVNAEQYFRLPTDGLRKSWGGVVYMNPPYGRNIGRWTQKLIDEYAAGNIHTAIALVPVKTDTKWWNALAGVMACWCAVRGRIRFDSPTGASTRTGTFASACVLLTQDAETVRRFTAEFSDLGTIWGAHTRKNDYCPEMGDEI